MSLQFLFLFLFGISTSNSYKILFVAAPESKSHRGSMYPLATALKTHGHDVTIFSLVLIDHNENEGPVKEKFIKQKYPDQHLINAIVYQNDTDFIKFLWEYDQKVIMLAFGWKPSADGCAAVLRNQLGEFWQVANQTWDLIVVDWLITTCGIAIASLKDVPDITFHTSLLDNPTAEIRGLPGVPHLTPPMFDVTSHPWSVINFSDRLRSVTESWLWHLTRVVIHYIMKSAIGNLIPDFSFSSYTRDAAAVFIDYPKSIYWPRPIGMDSIYIGSDCKLQQGKPLPQDLEEFVNDPQSKGTIVVASGTMGNWDAAPKYMSSKFFKALSQMTDYRVIFQFKGDPSIFPNHINVMPWLPQTDILLHPKTKLFISHGGLKSFKETVCAEVPVLYFPLFAEQRRNALAAEVLGIGERLNKHTFQPETMVAKMKQVLESTSYKMHIQKLKARWLDQPMSQLDEGVFWAEYIIRRKGMPKVFHRRSKDLHWFQYWSLDIIVIAAISLGLLSFAAIRLASKVLTVFHRSKN